MMGGRGQGPNGRTRVPGRSRTSVMETGRRVAPAAGDIIGHVAADHPAEQVVAMLDGEFWIASQDHAAHGAVVVNPFKAIDDRTAAERHALGVGGLERVEAM